MENKLVHYLLGIADNNLILGQRLGELCGHGPTLETDIALTNISLDLLGQVRSYYQYAATLLGDGATEDTLAFLRNERQYRNALLCEQANINFAFTIGRQFLFDQYHLLFLQMLTNSTDAQLKAIALKSVKEVKYHVRFSGDWFLRLGDGTEESKQKMQEAIDALYVFTDELFEMDEDELAMCNAGVAVDVRNVKNEYFNTINHEIRKAGLIVPDVTYFQRGGKEGRHSEQMGYLLAEMQFMQRTYPNMTW
ncbi:MAG: 1,2-phenylacetyl-CoA epoxidase subunit PaaC [Bacteroidia bacterium]|jgi:ring-1,2-phenylacetyl-CoA epoxidase subunit PaaC